MSVLLIGLGETLTEVVAARLLEQGDEVRLVLAEETERERWRARGVHVAVGDMADEDFAWRACMNVRTVVAGDHHPLHPPLREVLAGVLRKAGVGRVVAVGAGEPDELVGSLRAEPELEHVILRFRRRGLLGAKDAVAPADLAVAVDAADDLAGSPRLDLDLTRDADWKELRLDPPGP